MTKELGYKRDQELRKELVNEFEEMFEYKKGKEDNKEFTSKHL